ncbi:MAG: hypothetical protein A2281_09285 [Bacteroidetes bacterium RIFOXYA12_FULL_38_20]|nr:MAG: hypothetical protein UR43_C0025G0005 [candidate division TM6 bacterium GW2011_GWF2_33_332]OFY79239.1 MAG: hypothetical protein A2281_09285 [Bacteroidetes bacterium RIFOXYA12_FULL_38_20]
MTELNPVYGKKVLCILEEIGEIKTEMLYSNSGELQLKLKEKLIELHLANCEHKEINENLLTW